MISCSSCAGKSSLNGEVPYTPLIQTITVHHSSLLVASFNIETVIFLVYYFFILFFTPAYCVLCYENVNTNDDGTTTYGSILYISMLPKVPVRNGVAALHWAHEQV